MVTARKNRLVAIICCLGWIASKIVPTSWAWASETGRFSVAIDIGHDRAAPRVAQSMPAPKSFGLHTGNSASVHRRVTLQPWPASVAVADRDVDFLAREVDVVERRADAQVDARVGLGEAARRSRSFFRRGGRHGE